MDTIIDRRLEHKFPAAWYDAIAAYTWIAENAKQIEVNPSRLALLRENAGGNLAIATAVAACGAGITPSQCVLAIYSVGKFYGCAEFVSKAAEALKFAAED